MTGQHQYPHLSTAMQSVLTALKYVFGVVTVTMVALTVLSILTSCHKDLQHTDLSDVREVSVSYTVPEGRDFPTSIARMQWLVYDAQGRYFCELQMEPKQCQYFDSSLLPDGQYTVVNIANNTSKTVIDHSQTLDDLLLSANTRQPEGWYSNVDCLFWQMRQFTVRQGYVDRVAMPLADIHCHLHVHVWWKGLPGESGQWTLRLYGVNVGYHAGRLGLTIGGLEHPELTDALGEHRIDVVPLNFELDGEFVVYRWTDSNVPRLQVWCDDAPVSPLIDILQVFNEWQWSPDNTTSQDYWLGIQLNPDGSADVQTWGRARVADWIDGGVIGY